MHELYEESSLTWLTDRITMSLNKSSRSKSTVRSSEKEKKDDFLATYLPFSSRVFREGEQRRKGRGRRRKGRRGCLKENATTGPNGTRFEAWNWYVFRGKASPIYRGSSSRNFKRDIRRSIYRGSFPSQTSIWTSDIRGGSASNWTTRTAKIWKIYFRKISMILI